jgi:hypothetical protein
MKIAPIAGPGAIQQAPQESEQARTARLTEKFVKITSGNQNSTAQEHPVRDANHISPEEMSAVKPTLRQQSEVNQTLPPNSDNSTQSEPEVTAKAQTAKDPETERRFAQIARQERALRAKAQQQDIAYKQREAALKAREEALTAPQTPDLSQYIPRDRVKQDALSVLEESGVSWDELTQQVVNRQPTDPRVNQNIARLEAKIQQLEAANQASQKTYAEQQTANYQAAVKQIKADVKQLVYTDPEFETIKAMKATNDVVELIEQTYAKDGIVLSVEDAAKEVENYLVEEGLKITQISKIKARMAAANASRPATQEKTQSNQQTQMKTLTNASSSTRPLTVRERAIAAAEGRLK